LQGGEDKENRAGNKDESRAKDEDKSRTENHEENPVEGRDGNRADGRREDQDRDSGVQSARSGVDRAEAAVCGWRAAGSTGQRQQCAVGAQWGRQDKGRVRTGSGVWTMRAASTTMEQQAAR
jgi:hypothetical protein